MTEQERAALMEWLQSLAPHTLRYYQTVEDGCIVSIGIGPGGEPIGAAVYEDIRARIDAAPTPPEGYGYRLRTDLRWELYPLPEPEEEEETLDPARALEMICGKSDLTRTEAIRYQNELKNASAEIKERREE